MPIFTSKQTALYLQVIRSVQKLMRSQVPNTQQREYALALLDGLAETVRIVDEIVQGIVSLDEQSPAVLDNVFKVTTVTLPKGEGFFYDIASFRGSEAKQQNFAKMLKRICFVLTKLLYIAPQKGPFSLERGQGPWITLEEQSTAVQSFVSLINESKPSFQEKIAQALTFIHRAATLGHIVLVVSVDTQAMAAALRRCVAICDTQEQSQVRVLFRSEAEARGALSTMIEYFRTKSHDVQALACTHLELEVNGHYQFLLSMTGFKAINDDCRAKGLLSFKITEPPTRIRIPIPTSLRAPFSTVIPLSQFTVSSGPPPLFVMGLPFGFRGPQFFTSQMAAAAEPPNQVVSANQGEPDAKRRKSSI